MFTTALYWNAYPSVEYDGVFYGMKSDSFRPYLGLPRKVGPIFELVMTSNAELDALLTTSGWRLRNPLQTARNPWSYQQYIQQSRAEFSVAKHGYVVSESGWFSERSAAYLASGRPVLVQDTGFSRWLPSGLGVVPFKTPEQAVLGIDAITREYQAHCRAARLIAEEFFDARKVLPQLVERAMSSTADREGRVSNTQYSRSNS